MIKHFFVSTIRSLWRHKFHTLVNMMGFAIGLACCIFILLYIKDELSYDKFNENADNIYRIYVNGKLGEMDLYFSETAPPTGPAFRDELPEVKDFVRLQELKDVSFNYEDRTYIENDVYLVDSSFLSIFTFPLLQGDPGTALNEPYTIVLTESIARKYFGDGEPMGKSLKMGDDPKLYRITGVMPDLTHRTHFDFVMLVSIYSSQSIKREIWLSHFLNTYLLLEDGSDKVALESKLPDIINKYLGPEMEGYTGVSMEQLEEQGSKYGMYLEPLTDIHFNTEFERALKPGHNRSYIYIFSIVALFIMIIAVINFMNLATARSQTRSKEVGIRKVVGSGRPLLIKQFLFESMLLTLFSLGIGILLVELLIGPFNNLIQLNLSVGYIEKWYYIPAILVFTIFIGLLAGSYPAFYLSSFNPITIINKTLLVQMRRFNFRNILVFVQFFISIFIIIGTIFIYRQISYLQSTDLGFNREQLLILPSAQDLEDNYDVFREQILQLPDVQKMTRSSSIPGNPSNTSGYKIEGDQRDQTYLLETNYADYDFFETFGFELYDGRNFSEAFGADSTSMLINEAAGRTFALSDPINTRMISPEIPGIKEIEFFDIIGVIKDFHFESMHTDIRPYTLLLSKEGFYGGFISIRLGAENINRTINQIERIWQDMSSGPMAYYFLDDWFNSMYEEEKRTGSIFVIFSILAIFIAALGLFGLSSFIAEQRTKEIGIRKAMGSTGYSVIGLLSKQIMILITISAACAFPAAWLFMRDWLQDFAYKIDLNWYIFLLAYLIAMFIAFFTTFYHSLAAAGRNPAVSLRYE